MEIHKAALQSNLQNPPQKSQQPSNWNLKHQSAESTLIMAAWTVAQGVGRGTILHFRHGDLFIF